MKALLLLLVIATLGTGCATVGRKLDQESVDKIKKGQTTREEVLKLIGAPDQMTRNGNGDVTFNYTYARATTKGASFIPIVGAFAGGVNVQNQMVMVTFGPDGIVKDIVSTYGSTESGVGMSAGGKPSVNAVEEGKRPK